MSDNAKEWIIEEYPAYVEENRWKEKKYSAPREWSINPNIHSRDGLEDMEPDTLEACIEYLRDDPFVERSKYWVSRIRNIRTGEIIMYDAIAE